MGVAAVVSRRAAFTKLVKFFKSHLCLGVFLRMHRSRLEPCQADLMQPLADRAFVDFDRKAALDHVQQVHTSPAYDFVGCRVRSLDHQVSQFGHLRFCQKWRAARTGAGFQPFDTRLVVAMNPIAQGLPIHAVGRCGFAARMTIQNHRQRQEPANLRPVAALAGKPPQPSTRMICASDP